ncbi:MAG: hypothetical protein HYS06_04560 [Methylocystis sp.]|nr:hypothetical protein [Methylocystis sp.]
MAGLVPAIHADELLRCSTKGSLFPPLSEAIPQDPGVDARDKRGHDGGQCFRLLVLHQRAMPFLAAGRHIEDSGAERRKF